MTGIKMDFTEEEFMENYYDWTNGFIEDAGESEIVEICGVEFIIGGVDKDLCMRMGVVKAVYDDPKNARKIMGKLQINGKLKEIQEYWGDKASFGGDGILLITEDDDVYDDE